MNTVSMEWTDISPIISDETNMMDSKEQNRFFQRIYHGTEDKAVRN